MEKRINVAELLKDCPEGMELDCVMFEDVTFERVDMGVHSSIVIDIAGEKRRLTKYGCWSEYPNAKCVIFPKGKTTWQGLEPPCKFKDGDVVSDNSFYSVCIFKGEGNIKGTVDFYCGISGIGQVSGSDDFIIKDVRSQDAHFGYINEYKLASEEEKEKLFNAIKDNGYKWNAETKTLEKLIEPKFKVGDRIRSVISLSHYTIVDIKDDQYVIQPDDTEKFPYHIHFSLETNYELVPKFDINTLIPFESKVLVRDSKAEKWRPAVWGFCDESIGSYLFEVVGGHGYTFCIPYEGNKHLLGTTEDCEDRYKLWLS